MCKLNLIAGDSEESADRLDRYLNYESIRAGDAIQAIADDYQNFSKQRQAEMSLPEAWTKLVQEEDEFLLEVVAEKTKDLSGYKPSSEKVLKFLRCLDTEKAEAPSETDTAPLAAPINPDEGSQEHLQESSRTITKCHPYLIEKWSQLFVPLQQRILASDNSVSETIDKKYIAYKKGNKNFALLGGTEEWFSLRLVLDVSEIQDPREVCMQNQLESHLTTVLIAKIGNARPKRYDFTKPLYALDSVDELDNISYKIGDLDYLMCLIRQAFENN